MPKLRRRAFAAGTAALALTAPSIVAAQKKYDPGVSDSEIKLGHTNPYSGPLSAYGVIGKGITAFWQMVNDQGGVNGRKVNFITYDDGFQPPKTVEMVRKLVEDDRHRDLSTLGATNTVVQKASTRSRLRRCSSRPGVNGQQEFRDYGLQPDYATEAASHAKHHGGLSNGVAMLYQNDDPRTTSTASSRLADKDGSDQDRDYRSPI